MKGYLLLRLFFIFPVLTYTVRPTIQHPALIRSESSFRTLGESLHIRGGFDKHRTGKFVVEHRPSKVDLSELSSQNSTISRKASCFPIATLNDLYELEGVLGEGGFASVRRARHRITQNMYAIKTIDLFKIKADQLDSLRNEIAIMKMLDHPNVIKLYETFEEESQLHLVLELCEGGDLFDFITKTSIDDGRLIWSNGNVSFVWTEARLAEVFRKMLSAVAYLHQRGIAHRDIKPENFLLESAPDSDGPGEVKIIDFGFSRAYHGTDDMHNTLGTAYYVAPEVLGARSGQGYGPKCDLWSMGVIFYMMLTGLPPFDGDDMYSLIASGEYVWPDDVVVSDDAKDLVARLLTVSPRRRASAAEALRHRWLSAAAPAAALVFPSVAHLSRIRSAGRLKKEALLAIGYALGRDQIRDLSLTFRALDKEGTGVLSLTALKEGLRRGGMPDGVAEKVFESFSQISEDSVDGEVDYTSFVAACLEKRSYLEQSNLYEAFYRFQDDRGFITAESMRGILGDKFSAKESEDMVAEADLDGDGQISFAEFSLMMGNRLPVSRVVWRELPLLDGLTADEVSQVFEISQLRRFERGEDLMTQGAPSDCLFMIEDGELEVTRYKTRLADAIGSESPEGMRPGTAPPPWATQYARNAPGDYGPGYSAAAAAAAAAAASGEQLERDTVVVLAAKTVVGEMEMLTRAGRMATVTATRPVRAQELKYDDFLQLLARNTVLGYKVMTNLAKSAASSIAQLNNKMSSCNAVLDLYLNDNRAGHRRPAARCG